MSRKNRPGPAVVRPGVPDRRTPDPARAAQAPPPNQHPPTSAGPGRPAGTPHAGAGRAEGRAASAAASVPAVAVGRVGMDLERRRLRSALGTARKRGSFDADTVKGLAVMLRSLGLGQVFAHLHRTGDRTTARALADWVVEVEPTLGAVATGNRRPDVLDVLTNWRAVERREVVSRVEAQAVAWAVDLKLLAVWCEVFEADAALVSAPTKAPASRAARGGPAAVEAADRLAARRAEAARAAFRLRADAASPTGLGDLATRLASLPYELQSEGLLRALAGLGQEGRSAAGSVTRGLGTRALARGLIVHLAEVFPDLGGAPRPAVKLADLLSGTTTASDGSDRSDRRDRTLAHALEAEALAWVLELKTYVTALAAHSEGA